MSLLSEGYLYFMQIIAAFIKSVFFCHSKIYTSSAKVSVSLLITKMLNVWTKQIKTREFGCRT